MARTKGPKKVHRYSAEFKLKAVKLSQLEGVRVQDVADALEIPRMNEKCRNSRGGGAAPGGPSCWTLWALRLSSAPPLPFGPRDSGCPTTLKLGHPAVF